MVNNSETHPPSPLPLLFHKGKGEINKRGGFAPSLKFLPLLFKEERVQGVETLLLGLRMTGRGMLTAITTKDVTYNQSYRLVQGFDLPDRQCYNTS
jgi:hypothetical protein